MKFEFHSTEQEDVLPQLGHLQQHLERHGLADDAAGRQCGVEQMLNPGRPLEENRYYDYLKHLVIQYDPQESSQIDRWLEAVVAGRPEIAGKLYVDSLTEALKLDGSMALLRAGVDLAIAVPGIHLSIANSSGAQSKITDASPIAAMVCYLDPEGWALLLRKNLLPTYDRVPYAGRFQQIDGSFTDFNLLDYVLKTKPGPMEHLIVLDRLRLDSPAVQLALADGAVSMIKQRDDHTVRQGEELTRAALFIGAGADLVRVAEGIKDEKMCSLPGLLASVQSFEYREYILRAAQAVANAGRENNLPEELRAVFDIDFREDDGFTPLHMAAGYGYPEVVACYIAAGADVNAGDNDLKTPLHEAAASAGLVTIEILLDAGADINAETRYGLTAEMSAQNNGQRDTAQMLAAHRARQAVAGVLNRARTARSASSAP